MTKRPLFFVFATLALCAAQTVSHAQAPAKPAVYCAVTGEKIGDAKAAAGHKTVGGKNYYFCCAGCTPKFNAAPTKYAKLADLRGQKRDLDAKLAKVNADLKQAEAGLSTTM